MGFLSAHLLSALEVCVLLREPPRVRISHSWGLDPSWIPPLSNIVACWEIPCSMAPKTVENHPISWYHGLRMAIAEAWTLRDHFQPFQCWQKLSHHIQGTRPCVRLAGAMWWKHVKTVVLQGTTRAKAAYFTPWEPVETTWNHLKPLETTWN